MRRFIFGFIGTALIFIVIVLIGSYFMRAQVIRTIKNRALTSSSVVLTRALPMSPGINISTVKLLSRLGRLRFERVSSVPERAGQYFFQDDKLAIYFREAQLPSGKIQGEVLVLLLLDSNSVVTEIIDVKFQRRLTNVWLEPEIISLLGSSETRASQPKTLKDFPEKLIQAVLAIEDERFYSHFGLDPIAMVRALLVDLRHGQIVQGASTVTQQLAKNLFLSRERSLWRKLVELFDAVLIETAFSKDLILQFYLNEVFLGQEGNVAIHGFGEASRSFFGHEVEQLTLPEAATLAGIIKGPSRYSPRQEPDRAKARRAVVLQKMHQLKMISDQELHESLDAPLHLNSPHHTRRVAPYFVDFVRKQVEAILGSKSIDSQTLKVHTGLDREYQLCATNAVTTGLGSLEKTHRRLRRKKEPLQAALVALAPASGEIRAWVGGRNYAENQFDRISLAKRQPGSTFKPFVYLTALDKNLNSYRVARTTSIIVDEPIMLERVGLPTWEPQNYDNHFRGDVTIREALVHSLNVPTVNLALKVGIPAVKNTADLFGIGKNILPVPAMSLGAGEVSPFGLTRAYGALASGGLMIELRPLMSITTEHSEIPLFESPLVENRIASEPAVYVLTTILQDVVKSGTGHTVRDLGFTQQVAGKTGTTNDARDAWFVGFTPSLLALVWVGFDDNSELGLTGAQAAAPIWTDFMKCASKMEPTLDFIPPSGVVTRRIDDETGLLATDSCPSENIVTEVFVEGTEPITPCVKHDPDSLTAQRSLLEFPAPRREEQVRPPPFHASEASEESFWGRIFGGR